MITPSMQKKPRTVALYWDLFQEVKIREQTGMPLCTVSHTQVKLCVLQNNVLILQLEKLSDIKHIILLHTGTI